MSDSVDQQNSNQDPNNNENEQQARQIFDSENFDEINLEVDLNDVISGKLPVYKNDDNLLIVNNGQQIVIEGFFSEDSDFDAELGFKDGSYDRDDLLDIMELFEVPGACCDRRANWLVLRRKRNTTASRN